MRYRLLWICFVRCIVPSSNHKLNLSKRGKKMETWIGILHSIIIEWLIEIDQLLSAYFSLFIEHVFQTVITYRQNIMYMNTDNVLILNLHRKKNLDIFTSDDKPIEYRIWSKIKIFNQYLKTPYMFTVKWCENHSPIIYCKKINVIRRKIINIYIELFSFCVIL